MRLIDADELLEKAEYISTGFKSRGMQVCFHGVTAATIENAPTIDPESLRPTAHWKCLGEADALNYGGTYAALDCSRCGWRVRCKSDYCPRCGAKMEDCA